MIQKFIFISAVLASLLASVSAWAQDHGTLEEQNFRHFLNEEKSKGNYDPKNSVNTWTKKVLLHNLSSSKDQPVMLLFMGQFVRLSLPFGSSKTAASEFTEF